MEEEGWGVKTEEGNVKGGKGLVAKSWKLENFTGIHLIFIKEFQKTEIKQCLYQQLRGWGSIISRQVC